MENYNIITSPAANQMVRPIYSSGRKGLIHDGDNNGKKLALRNLIQITPVLINQLAISCTRS